MPRKSAASLHFATVNSSSERLRPPPQLSESERQLFLDTVAGAKPGHFHSVDTPLLCAYVRAAVLEIRSAQEVADGDDKALSKWNGAIKALSMLSMRLRLCPQSRQPNNPSRPSRPEQPMSYYDRMALERREAAGR
jgi:hypothetical protein